MNLVFQTDCWNAEEWDQLINKFPSANIYQTGLYGQLHSTGVFRSYSRAAAFKDSDVSALAQLRIKKIPLLNIGVAEIDWGPVWNFDNDNINRDIIDFMLENLKHEYCRTRKLELRMNLRSTFSADRDARLENICRNLGFQKNLDARPYHTVIIDLNQSLENIRKNFHQKWRNQLNVAERANLIAEYGYRNSYFDRFYKIYKAMWAHKRFPTGVILTKIQKLHRQLPDDQKFLITIIRDDRMDIGATVCAVKGDTMHYFLGATQPDFKTECRPGYLLQWLHIQKAKELRLRWYDLGGYDDDNQSIARFKKRMKGKQVIFPGQYEYLPKQKPSKIYMFLEKTYRKTRHQLTGR